MNKNLLALMMVFGLMALGWRGLRPVARPPVHVFAEVDRSLSAEPQLGQYAHVLADLTASLEEQDQLTLYRFDYTGTLPTFENRWRSQSSSS